MPTRLPNRNPNRAFPESLPSTYDCHAAKYYSSNASTNQQEALKMGMISEFKEFAMRGNVMDMAVGIIIGGAFGKIVSSLVSDLIMPPLGMLLGKVNFSDLAVTLQEASGETAAVTLNYGMFLQTTLDFIIIAAAIFLVIKGMNSLKKKQEAEPAAPPVPSREEILLSEIRDLLKQK
jgi:large conductance mechanosensitive channel